MCVDHVLRQWQGPIVANCASSRMSEDLANRYGVPYLRAAVGEANVVDTMLAGQALFGGEGNGGPIDPRVGYVRDSFVGMAQLLDAMASRDVKLSTLADELPRYEIVKTKIALPPEKLAAGLDAVEAQSRHMPGVTASRLDGLRLDWADRWLLVRGSNTEPIVRAIAEAPAEKPPPHWQACRVGSIAGVAGGTAVLRGYAIVFSERHAHGGRGHGTQHTSAKVEPSSRSPCEFEVRKIRITVHLRNSVNFIDKRSPLDRIT
jgi:hypothetical protein